MEYNIDILVAGCNTTCQHCYVNGGIGQEMSIEDFKLCIEKLKPSFECLGEKISFTLDNEVYNHSRADLILKYVEEKCKKNYYHHGSTTGIAILNHPKRQEIIEILKRNCWMEVSFAIHGGIENHNQMVRNEKAMQSIQEAYQLFESEGFDIWFSIMLSKVLRADIDEVSKLLSDFSNYRGIAVIPNYIPTKRLKDYQKYRCTQEECKGFISFLNEHHIETKKLIGQVEEFHEEKIIQTIDRERMGSILEADDTVFFHILPNLDFYVGNTGIQLKYIGNMNTLNSAEIGKIILEQKGNYYETLKCHYDDMIESVEKGNLELSKENYVYPSMVDGVLAMIENFYAKNS